MLFLIVRKCIWLLEENFLKFIYNVNVLISLVLIFDLVLYYDYL